MIYVIVGVLAFDSFILMMISLNLSNIYRAIDRVAREVKEKKL